MAKSLREIAQAFEDFLGGRKVDLRDYNFDDLSILNQGNQGNQQEPVELSVEEIREMMRTRRFNG